MSWVIGYCHPLCKPFVKKVKTSKKAIGISLIPISLIIPDLGFFAVLGVVVLSGVPFKVTLRSYIHKFKVWRRTAWL